MRTTIELSGALICIALLAAGCSQKSDPAEPSAAAAPSPAPAEVMGGMPDPLAEMPVEADVVPPEVPETTATGSPAATVAPVEPAPAAPVAAPAPAAAVAPAAVVATPPPAPAAPVAPVTPTPVAAAATPDIVDPGGVIAVAATKPGLKRIGSEDCGDCHDVQYDSWVKDPHGTRTPPLDCEHCHGPGSEYKPKAVMQDPARARAAGLVIPGKDFCAQCHKKGVTDAFMKRVHAHAE
jgi:hypothetical protein